MQLSKWRLEYANDIAKSANNKKIADNLMDVFPHPYSLDDAKSYINYCIGLDEKTHLYRAIIVDGKAVGSISITMGTDIHSKTGEIGYWLAEDHWRRGIMKRAIKEICHIAFKTLDIVRIYGEVFEYNVASCKVLEKCGFKLEGELQNAVYKNGNVYNALVYGFA